MAVNEPTLSRAEDKAAAGGDTVTLYITPPAAGDYDHTQIRYRLLSETAWTTGPTYTGAQGVAGTKDVTSLTPGSAYEFACHAIDAASEISTSSLPVRATPTTSGDTIQKRIEDNFISALEGITQGGGAFADVQDVLITRSRPDTKGWDGFYILVNFMEAEKNDQLLRTAGQMVEDCRLNVAIAACYAGRTATEAWTNEICHSMLSDVATAALEDETRGDLAIWTREISDTTNPEETLKTLADAVAEAAYEIRFFHYKGNHKAQPC